MFGKAEIWVFENKLLRIYEDEQDGDSIERNQRHIKEIHDYMAGLTF